MKLRLGVGVLILAVLLALTEAAVRDKRQHLQGPRTCEENEEYSCGSSCQTECSSLNEPCYIINIRCINGCYCKENFARETIGGRCIPISQCQ